MKMRNKIFGGIGILWGGLMTAQWIFGTSPQASADGATAYSASYAAGTGFAHVLGVLMLIAGLYYFFKKPNKSL
jgi:hypothetical protein